MYKDASKRLMYRDRWYEVSDIIRICNDKGYAQAACRFRRAEACARRAQILSVGLVGGAFLGIISSYGPNGTNPAATGLLIAAGGSGLAAGYYSIRSGKLEKRGVQAFNEAVDIEMSPMRRSYSSRLPIVYSGPVCKRLPFIFTTEAGRMRHRLSPNALTDMVLFDGQLMSFEKAAVYADENHIAGAGDLLRQLAALPRPKEHISIGPVTLNNKEMRDYVMAKNELVKQIMAAVRQHNRSVRKQG